MSEVVGISAATRTVLLGLQRTRTVLEVASEHITTGLKVKSSLDGTAAFFDAQGLTNRAANLLSLKDSMSDAATVVGTAVEKIDAMIALIDKTKSTINAAKGAANADPVATVVTGDIIADASAAVASLSSAASGDSFEVTYNGVTTEIAINGTTTFSGVATAISNISGLAGSVSDGNALKIIAADGQDIVITNKVNDLASDLTLNTSTNGTLASNDERRAAEAEFDLIRKEIGALAGDSTILGHNLLGLAPDTITLDLSDISTSSLSFTGTSTNMSTLGITAVDDSDSFVTDSGITAAVAELDAAKTTLIATRSGLQSNLAVVDARLAFNEELLKTVEEGAALLTEANIDAEKATKLALETRHDLGINALGFSFTNGTALTQLLNLSR
jgi:hypothetical protein